MARWLVDGMNVIGSRPDGWWRDRPAAQRRLTERLVRFAEGGQHELTVIFDGRPREMDASERVDVRFASRRGANAADDDIAAWVERDPEPDELTVVTSDGELGRRVRDSGARSMGAGTFLDLLDYDDARAGDSTPDSSSNSRRLRSSPPP